MSQHASADAGQQPAGAEHPAWTPGPRELAHLELLLAGAYRPLEGFLGAADVRSVAAYGTLADGTPWPVPIVLPVPDTLADASGLILQDPEGAPLAALETRERWQRDGAWHLAGPVWREGEPQYGAFRRLRRAPEDVAADLAGGAALAVVAERPLLGPDLAAIRRRAEGLGARILVLPLLTVSRPDALVRSVLAVRDELPPDALVVPVPLPPSTGGDSSAEDEAAGSHSAADCNAASGDFSAEAGRERAEQLRAHVTAAYGATHLLSEAPTRADRSEGPIPRVAVPTMARDERDGVWRPAADVPPERRREVPRGPQLDALLDAGEPIPDHVAPPALVRELRRARPPLHERGLTVFFTGLSGSGKSTIARGLYDALLERGDRSVTLLDGDVVRRMLSAGLTFSKADRDLNIRRIGYVAAEVSRHGGLAICAPIAPYAATRAEVRRMVEEVGDFALVHVATPLEECERRDRKGLYAKARAGEIREFTGISDPYEEPDDAELVLDTTGMPEGEAVRAVLDTLVVRGWLRTRG